MKKLSFAVKANMNKPPRVHVQSSDKKTTYGAFQANDCNEFNSWEKLSPEETIELKQYMNKTKTNLPPQSLHSFAFMFPWNFCLSS